MSKRRAFNFHYNKPASKKAGKPQITIHYKGTCHIVDNVVCMATTIGKIRKRQPFFVMAGYCSTIDFQDKKAFIYDFQFENAVRNLKKQHKHD